MNFINTSKVYLGSNSPRRKFLMEALGIQCEVLPSHMDEIIPDGMPAEEAPVYLAREKNNHIRANRNVDGALVTADTVVIHQSRILGKPKNREEAIAMLRSLSSTRHSVITGVCISSSDRSESFSSHTYVTFGELSLSEIDYYVTHYEVLDKAGAYGIQDWIGHAKVTKLEGSFTNVMGLPTESLYERIKSFVDFQL